MESSQFSELGWELLSGLRGTIHQIETSEGYDPSQAPEREANLRILIKHIFAIEAELREPSPDPHVVAHADELRAAALWMWAHNYPEMADGSDAATGSLSEAAPTPPAGAVKLPCGSAKGLRLADCQASATASRHVFIAAARSVRCV